MENRKSLALVALLVLVLMGVVLYEGERLHRDSVATQRQSAAAAAAAQQASDDAEDASNAAQQAADAADDH